jgi:hypothetical protein
MTAVSNASPLITLARGGQLESLREIFEMVVISREVYEEVVTAGARMPGALAVSRVDGITVSAIQDSGAMALAVIARRSMGKRVGRFRCFDGRTKGPTVRDGKWVGHRGMYWLVRDGQ